MSRKSYGICEDAGIPYVYYDTNGRLGLSEEYLRVSPNDLFTTLKMTA